MLESQPNPRSQPVRSLQKSGALVGTEARGERTPQAQGVVRDIL